MPAGTYYLDIWTNAYIGDVYEYSVAFKAMDNILYNTNTRYKDAQEIVTEQGKVYRLYYKNIEGQANLKGLYDNAYKSMGYKTQMDSYTELNYWLFEATSKTYTYLLRSGAQGENSYECEICFTPHNGPYGYDQWCVDGVVYDPYAINEDNYAFIQDGNGDMRCYDDRGNMVVNSFMCDGTDTYFFQADGTAMRNRLTYHPDGEHVIYFDEYGHEVFSNFANVKKSIEGNPVDDLCFFNMYGYMYTDVVTYNRLGIELYYANPYGVMERNGWFQFSDTVEWNFTEPGPHYGYALSDGTLLVNAWVYDWMGRLCYLQGNGEAKY